MISKKPILITGSPRSGTTWVGRMIGQAPHTRYIHEPFNIGGYPCRCGTRFKYWFYYLSSDDEHNYCEHLNHIIYPAYNWVGLYNMVTEVYKSKRIRPFFHYLQSYALHRPLLKAPIAVFSAKTLTEMFGMDVIVMIRHPAAVVSSYKSLNWKHPFSHFLNQPELMDEHLSDFKTEIEDFVRNQHDIVDQAALLWKLIYHMVNMYQETQVGWHFIQYENIALDPIAGYENLFKQLDLPFTEHVRCVVQEHSLQDRLKIINDPYAIKQNPQHAISKWKNQLTPEEIHRIRLRVEEVSCAFYTEDDWSIETV